MNLTDEEAVAHIRDFASRDVPPYVFIAGPHGDDRAGAGAGVHANAEGDTGVCAARGWAVQVKSSCMTHSLKAPGFKPFNLKKT